MTATSTEPTCEICGEKLVYSGRGRPPKRCEKHKRSPAPQPNGTNSESQGEKKMESTRPRPGSGSKPRPRPGQKSQANGAPSDEQPDAKPPPVGIKLPPVGKSDSKSRAKAELSSKQAASQSEAVEVWPTNPQGKPMAKIVFSASELVPTGQYANVSIGPVQITTFVDLDRAVGDEEPYFTDAEKDVIVRSANELADMAERDIIGLQRNMVLESMQEQLASS